MKDKARQKKHSDEVDLSAVDDPYLRKKLIQEQQERTELEIMEEQIMDVDESNKESVKPEESSDKKVDLSTAIGQKNYLKQFGDEALKVKNPEATKEAICELIRQLGPIFNTTDLDNIAVVCSVKKNDNKKKKDKKPKLKLDTKQDIFDGIDDGYDDIGDEYDFM